MSDSYFHRLRRGLSDFASFPGLAVIMTPFVLMAPVLLTGKALFWGVPALQFVPWWDYAWKTLVSGHLPLWNPLVGMGAPLIANYQSALFYPPNWLYLILAAVGGTPAIAWGLSLLVALHLAWAGLGMALLARRLGLGNLAQTISGLAFSLSGYLVARAGFLSINSATAWLPWLLLAALNVTKTFPVLNHPDNNPDNKGNHRPLRSSFLAGIKHIPCKSILYLAVCGALQLLAGHAQVTWYSLLLTGLWIGLWGWYYRGIKGWLISWIYFLAAMFIAVALAAVQLLPTAEYLLQSQRASAVDFNLAMTYSFWPWRLLGLIVPGFFGSPVWGDYWGYANFWEDAIYIGILPLFLALAALFKENKLGHLRWFLVAILSVAFLFALGKNTPIFPWLYQHLPSFNLFQAPARWMIWIEFALALLAGYGVEGWRRPQGWALYWTRLGTAAAFAMTAGAGLTWLFVQSGVDIGRLVTMVNSTAQAGFWALGMGILSLVAPISGWDVTQSDIPTQSDKKRKPKTERIWGYMITLWVSLDLLVAGWGLNPAIPLNFYNTTLPSPGRKVILQVKSELDDGRLFLPAQDETTLMYKRFFRFNTFDPPIDQQGGEGWYDLWAALLPNLNIYENMASVNNYDPIISGRYARWMTALDQVDREKREYLLDFMGVSMVETIDTHASIRVRFDKRLHSSRFHWSGCARLAKSAEEALKLTLEGAAQVSPVVLEGISSENTRWNTTEGKQNGELCLGVAKIQKINENPNRLVLSVNNASEGWLWIADVGYPGWKAWVDSNPTKVVQANYLFRAVFVPKGNHEVILAYQPFSFYWGVGISLLAWLGLTIWFILPNMGKWFEIRHDKNSIKVKK